MPIRVLHNERILLRGTAEGDQRAFTQLFDAYYGQLGDYIFRLTESREITEEILQDVFVKVWQKRELLPGLKSFTDYLFILSRNHTLNTLRKKANEEARSLRWISEQKEPLQAQAFDPSDEYWLLIDAAVARLPKQQKKVYLLSRRERLKHEEIASMMNISAETVKKHVQLALAAIRKYLLEHKEALLLLIPLFLF